jgi:hypothetical protein
MVYTVRSLFLVLLILSYNPGKSQILVGKKVDEVKNIILTDSTINLLVESAQFETVRIAKLDSFNCHIYITETGQIGYISLGDDNFITSETLKIGSKFKTVLKVANIKKDQIFEWPGWGKIVVLPSGWNAVFDFKKPLKPGSRIQFFFQSLRLLNSLEAVNQTP